jgi:manganese-dependent inorganic pyrophosphatase
MQTLVIGHRNPDMDAICSAVAYAEFKRATGDPSAVAGRCGNTNERIEYALARFGFEAPAFFADVRPRVGEVMETEVLSAQSHDPVYLAFARLGQRRVRGMPVVDAEGVCKGLLSAFDISREVFPPVGEPARSREVKASIEAIRRTIGAEQVAGNPDPVVREHTLVVVAMQTDTFQRRLGSLPLERTILIVGDRRNIQEMAIAAGTRALVISGGLAMDPDILAQARERGTAVLLSPRDTATTVLLARGAVTAGDLVDPDFLALDADLPLHEARARVALSPQFAFPVLDQGTRLVGIVSKGDFLKPPPRQLVLMDHNELSQAVAGASELPIVEILDHHRIGAAPTAQPILFLNKPVGSTCSIVAECFERERIPIAPPLAGLLMCGLISDTLNLTSPTTTPSDCALMERLALIAGVAPSTLAEAIFSVGSPLLTMSAERAILADCKEYQEAGCRFSVSQIEELTFAHFEEKREALSQALEAYRTTRNYDFCALLVTDINTQNSFLLMRGSQALCGLVDFPEAGDHLWRLDGVVSRKKQLLPHLSGLIARAR